MRPVTFSRNALLQAIFAMALLMLSATAGLAQFPAGDLTVTVAEQEDGAVTFTVSGTAYMQANASFYETNYSYSPPSPPTNALGTFSLPPGLKLTVPERSEMSEEESAEEGALLEIDLMLSSVYFSTVGWRLGSFVSGPLLAGDTLKGSGTVTTDTIPISAFVPGVYVVGSTTVDSEPEESPLEGSLIAPGVSPYFITYEVIPFDAAPALDASRPTAFPKTRVRRSGGSQEVTITNRGNITITNLSAVITGAAARDFSVGNLPVTQLAPGASTKVTVGFKPLRKGTRSAKLLVSGFYRDSSEPWLSAPEELPAEEAAPLPVSTSVPLEGSGVAPKRKPKPGPRAGTPRDPFGPGVDR